jgi:DNA-3-methyladenine glycosylase
VNSNHSLSNPVVPSFLKHSNKLKREFYTRPLITVAKELLGKILVKTNLAGKIVEVEAYDGSIDQAAHTFIGRTKRNEIMFGQGGYLYVYFTYGVHFCSNVVTGNEGQGTAVLIRALEPVFGIEEMIINRFGRDLKNEKEKLNLTNGPGKICQAFKINRDHWGADLTGNEIFIIDQPIVENKNIIVTKRIGISKSVDLPWRFYIKDNPWVSRK